MCGITGFTWDDLGQVKVMTTSLLHRGPDAQGYYTNHGISLGHRRLSIIDLSSAGKQPLTNEDETIWITFNGEIYNFKELRRELEAQGHIFVSHTDTEVIVHGYEQWGHDVLAKLNGQFAFAIWDLNKKSLFLARDRLGIKPLFYTQTKQGLIFASEIKAILEHNIDRVVNKAALYAYTNLRYVPGTDTLFNGIHQLAPGHSLHYKNKTTKIQQFWDVPLPQNKKANAQKIAKLFADSVQKRLHADVPVGAYLSGGLDSGLIVAQAASVNQAPIKTFTVGFDSTVDEIDKARIISEHYQTDHQEIILSEPIVPLLPKIIRQFDHPHGDPVTLPQYRLAQEAAKKVKVVLSGEGADECFGGYVQYKKMLQARTVQALPANITTKIAKYIPIPVLDKMFNYPASIGQKGKEKLLNFLEEKNELKKYLNLISILSKQDRQQLFTLPMQKNTYGQPAFWQASRKPLLPRMLYYDTKTWLPNYVLTISDRMTTAHSIEGRVPFLDHRLVEYAATVKQTPTKGLLRAATKGKLPEQTRQVKKQPFLMPLDKWFTEELHDLAKQLFTPQSVQKRGHYNYHHLKKMWDNYHRSPLLYGKQLFTVLNAEIWHRMYIDPETRGITEMSKLL